MLTVEPFIKQNITVRSAMLNDLEEIRQLYRDTISSINSQDYDEPQINLWSKGSKNIDNWKLREQQFFVAQISDKIVGFCSVATSGYLDYMFVHRNYQRAGIATKLLTHLEASARALNLSDIWADVSITAKPFFASKGFTVKKVYIDKAGNVEFLNTVMAKHLNFNPQ